MAVDSICVKYDFLSYKIKLIVKISVKEIWYKKIEKYPKSDKKEQKN